MAITPRKWGERRPGERYPGVEGPGNPDWEARNPQRPVTPGASTAPPTTMPPGLANGPAALMKATYNAVLKAKGVAYLSHNDPALLLIYQAVGGLTPEQAAVTAERAATYFKTNGYAISDAELNGLIAEARGPMTGDQTSPLVGVGAQIRQDYSDLSGARGTSLGANDQQFGAAIQSRVPGLTAQQAAQLAQRGRDFFLKTGVVIPDAAMDRAAGEIKDFRIPLPHQFDPGKWNALMADPTAAGLFEGTIRASGWDWDTYKRQQAASRPGGVVTPTAGANWARPTGMWG